MADLETIVQRLEAGIAQFDSTLEGAQDELRRTGTVSDMLRPLLC